MLKKSKLNLCASVGRTRGAIGEVPLLLEGLNGKVEEMEECGDWPTRVVTSVREQLWVMGLFLKKSMKAINLVPR